MSEDITKELPISDSEKLNQLLTSSRNIIAGLNQLDARITVLEAKDVITKPLWQEMRTDQQRVLDLLEQQNTRMTNIEARLQQQEEKLTALDEKVEVGFRKLGDKFDHLALDYYDLHADMRDLQRRVTRLEPVN